MASASFYNEDLQYLRGVLAGLRRRYRVLDLGHGAALLVAGLACLAALALLLDMTVHLPNVARWALFGLLGLAAVGSIAYIVGSVLIFPAGDRYLAVKVERRYPSLKNRLITSLQLSQRPEYRDGPEKEYLEALLYQTHQQVSQIDPTAVLPKRTARVPTYAALVGLVLLGLLSMIWAQGAWQSFRRVVVPWAAFEPPTLTKVMVEPQGAAVARGDAITLSAHTSGRPARSASLWFRLPGHKWTAIPMLPAAVSEQEPVTDFVYQIGDVQQPLEYYVSAGDAQTAIHRISLLERPKIRRLGLRIHYPEYLGLAPLEPEPGNYTVEAPIGSRVEVTVETEGEIAAGAVRLVTAASVDPQSISLKVVSPTRATGSFDVRASGSYSVIVENATGLTQKEVAAYPLLAQPDNAPLVEVIEPGRDLVLADRASVPVVARARDDFGLRSLRAAVFVGEPNREAFESSEGKPVSVTQTPGTMVLDGSLQIDLRADARFARADKVTYVFYAEDRKGNRVHSRPLTISVVSPAEVQQATAEDAEKSQQRLPAEELALLEQVIAEQRRALERTVEAMERAAKGEPALQETLREAFDRQKKAAGQMSALKTMAEQKRQDPQARAGLSPYHERALQAVADLMQSLRTHEVPHAMAHLSGAYQKAQAAAIGQGQPDQQTASAQQHTGAQQQGAESQQQTASGQQQTADSQQHAAAAQQHIAHAKQAEQAALSRLERMKELLEGSLPGQLNPDQQAALDKEIREQVSEFAGMSAERLQLASDKVQKAQAGLEALARQQERLRGRTAEVEAERVRNIAEPQDRLAVETGHAAEKMQEELPFMEQLGVPEALQQQTPMDQAGSPRIPIPPVPPAPRKDLEQGLQPPMPPVEMPGGLAIPKMLIPDRFPDTFWGELSDTPIPPPPMLSPTGRAPVPRLRPLTDEEKERNREISLDALEIDDAINAMGIGAPAEQEMPEEMLLEPGAQYARGPSAPDSKPGMELGQSAGQIQPGPNQPSMGGGSESPPGPRQESSQSQQSQGQQGQAQGRPQSLLGQAAGDMRQAAQSLGQSDRPSALGSQAEALKALREEQRRLAELRALLEELRRELERVDRTLERPDATQADALAALESALNSPAWGMGQQAPLTPEARSELGQLHQALAQARSALGGSVQQTSGSGSGRRSAELEGIEPEGRILVDSWAQYVLPEHLRRELLEGLREKGPEAYQKILEQYYRSIAKEQ